MRGSLRWRRGTTGNRKTRSSTAVKSHQCHESREAVLSSSGVGGWGLFFSPSLIIVLTQVREFIRLDPPRRRDDLFHSSHVVEPPHQCRRGRAGKNRANATTQHQNPGMPSFVRPVVPQSDPLCHSIATTAVRRICGEPPRTRIVEPLSPLSTCGIRRLPRRAWWGSGASRHPNIERCGHWAPACPAVRVGRGFMLVACAVAAVAAASSALGCSVAATLAAWERRWGAAVQRAIASWPCGMAQKVAPSAWRLCIQLVRAGKTTHRKRSWPIDKPGPPATTRRPPETAKKVILDGLPAGAKHAQFGRRRR